MSTEDRSPAEGHRTTDDRSTTEGRSTLRKLAVAGILLAVVALVVTVGLLLREHAPGNMGVGFLQGAAVGLLVFLLMVWRLSKRPDRATTFERAWSQTG